MALHRQTLRGLTRLLKIETPSGGRGVCDRLPRDSCTGGAMPVCEPCEPRAPPACRSTARAALRGLRAVCRPPPRANRPPCPAHHPPCALTCEHLLTQNASKSSSTNEIQCSTESPNSTSGRCGDTLDRVAQRISAAKLARRLDYEREVAERKKAIAPQPPPANYCLGADRETVRATDGRDYIVLPPHPTAATDSNIQRRTDTSSGTVDLDPNTSCGINRVPHMDPCAHHPRILLKIDRSDANNSSSSHRVSSSQNSVSKTSRCTPTNNQLRSRNKIGLSKKIDNKVTVPKKQCQGNCPERLTDWCSSPPKMAPEPPRCRQPSLAERLRRRPKSSCGGVRKLHSAITNLAECDNNKTDKHITSKADVQSIISQVITDTEKLNKMLSERNELKEAARGRIILEEQREEPTASGRLELRVPAGTHAVHVRVALHSDSVSRPIQPVRCSHSDTEIKRDALAAYSDKADSWLSIKNIQKKLSSSCKNPTHTNNPSSQEGVCPSQNASPKQAKQNVDESRCKPRQNSESSCERKQTKPNSSCEKKQKPKTNSCDLNPTPSCERESFCKRKQTKPKSSCETKQKPKTFPCDLKPAPEPRRCSSANELLPSTILSYA